MRHTMTQPYLLFITFDFIATAPLLFFRRMLMSVVISFHSSIYLDIFKLFAILNLLVMLYRHNDITVSSVKPDDALDLKILLK